MYMYIHLWFRRFDTAIVPATVFPQDSIRLPEGFFCHRLDDFLESNVKRTARHALSDIRVSGARPVYLE